MSEIKLYGPPQSSYVRTARWACAEKGVPHELVPVQLGSAEHRRLHPWAKVPILEHGDVRIYETSAIARYIDEAFDGPALTPATAPARARMEQWISALGCYMYDDGVRNYALQYIFPQCADGAPDRRTIDAAAERLGRDVAALDAAYADAQWIAGDALSLADLFIGPFVATFSRFPEGAKILAAAPHLARAFAAMEARAQYLSIQPPPPA